MALCLVCCEHAAVSASVICPAAGAHAICATCLPTYLLQLKPAQLEASLGEVPCAAQPSCCGHWPLVALKPFLDVDTLVAFASTLGFGLHEALSRRRRTEDDEKRMRAAVTASAPAERVRMLQALVTERDLFPTCPRCYATFVDFEGCWALTCERCDAGFCALCLADCGADAHAHVRNEHADSSRNDNEFRLACRKRSALAVVHRVQRLRDYPDLQRELVDALAGDLAVTGLDTAALSAAAGVPRAGAGGWSILHDAAVAGDLAKVDELVRGGCSVNATNELCVTLLQQAAFHGHINLIQWLLENGADASLTSNGLHGGTALHHGARMGSVEAVRMLLTAPGRATWINLRDKRGLSALHYASIGGHMEVVVLLVEAGAKVDLLSTDGRTARQYWIYHQGHAIPQSLLTLF